MIESMDWSRMLRGLWECGILPHQVLDETPVARIWAIWQPRTTTTRPHSMALIQEAYNRKRLAQGLAPLNFKKR
jgi:hypothetical protein